MSAPKIIRIGHKFFSRSRPNIEGILQPLQSKSVSYFRIEVLQKADRFNPKKHTQDINDIYIQLYNTVKQKGYIFYDMQPGNIGVLDNNFIIIDAGAVYRNTFLNRIMIYFYNKIPISTSYLDLKKQNLI